MKHLMPQTLRARIALSFVLFTTAAIILSAGVVYYLYMRVEQGKGILSFLRIETQISWLGEFLIVGLGLVGLFSLLAFVVARRLLSPVDELIALAQNLSHGEPRPQDSNPNDPEEVRMLTEAYNQIAMRMQANIDEMRSFVAYASHELRTPLTSIKLRVEALRNGALEDPPVTERFLSEIESEVDRLSRMVNDLLDLSRIEAGLEVNELVPVNLLAIASDVYETYKVRADRAGVNLTYDAEPDIPLILGEEDQLRRMIYNLMDNAIKYTPRDGWVRLIVRRSASGSSVELQVKDTGFGIAKEHLAHIFERFYRVEATRPRYGPPQGSGLGLPIARTIAEAHGGRIWVTSNLGEGTTFGVEFPILNGR
jgi:signal transduction histidine kinase